MLVCALRMCKSISRTGLKIQSTTWFPVLQPGTSGILGIAPGTFTQFGLRLSSGYNITERLNQLQPSMSREVPGVPTSELVPPDGPLWCILIVSNKEKVFPTSQKVCAKGRWRHVCSNQMRPDHFQNNHFSAGVEG